MEEKYKREVNRYRRGSGTWRRTTRERSTGTREDQGHGGEVQEGGFQVPTVPPALRRRQLFLFATSNNATKCLGFPDIDSDKSRQL